MIRTCVRFTAPAVRLGAVGLAAVLVLGGCSGSGGDPEAEAVETGASSASHGASASSSASPSVSVSVTPTPTAAVYKPATAEGPAENVPLPVMPELAKEESKEGLEAFAEYWYSLANYGYETGNPELVRNVSAESCFSCESYYRVIGKGYANSDWMTGAQVHVQDVSSNFVKTAEGYFQATIMITQDDLVFYGPEGYQGTETGSSTPGIQLMEAKYNTNVGWYIMVLETVEM